ncbi:universal stress protein [Subsaximicrobium wynnwilliamsii]|uniref:Universal stress protein n=1 Tax=Subsaximicrobium wynnwilliamsii TaxID=291179 RepID=A0A5C6ZHM2_9FLAO|nr:universal stress protein [Subsaximicrobium wynnwilliamsii]TXD83043.1 universal stress protein [Subsaximicrobium wynnwilliamsii]TXD88787.1 universal stress protein [Subsaximicrobium wynnwilliamsii]TXE02860.1 universal stress protein [Subsaximicrobium wynnwilliamsii]
MNKIIVPIDFSEHSEYALQSAALLAKRYDAELLALHMLDLESDRLTDSSDEQNEKMIFFLGLAKKRFHSFLDKDYLEGISVTPIVKHFRVFSEISNVAEEHKADLIVMGSHGASGLSEVFVGSNTEKVVRNSKTPVLVIKQKPSTLNFETVVFASDFNDEAVSAYQKVLQLFQGFGSKVHLLNVNVPGQGFRSSAELEKRLANFLQKADGNLDKINDIHYVSDYSVEKGIHNFSNLVGADLIAIPTHGRKGLAHLFSGSISEDIANHSSLPVITFKI